VVSRIVRSCSDDEQLLGLTTHQKFLPQPENYLNKVIIKPWGYEFLVYENEKIAIWFLHINKGHSTSMHCHRRKKTALMILSGKSVCKTLEMENDLTDLDALVLDPGVFHSTQSLDDKGTDLIEVETPPGKTDLIRLKDSYGRKDLGYEGLSEMETEALNRFNYFHFKDPTLFEPGIRILPLHTIKLGYFPNVESSDLCCFCEGEFVGEIVTGRMFYPRIDSRVMTLQIRKW
jgi:mannose-6-phosphate isomerase-like protein (cupin superfamily)